MNKTDIRKQAFAMPLTNPSYPRGPYRFIDREFLTITYRTDMEALRKVVPEPLEIPEPIVKYEFIRMPNSTGFGDYTESGQVIPVTMDGVAGGYVHAMFLNDEAPIAGGREIWGFPKAGRPFAARRKRYVNRHVECWFGSGGDRNDGIQAPNPRY